MYQSITDKAVFPIVEVLRKYNTRRESHFTFTLIWQHIYIHICTYNLQYTIAELKKQRKEVRSQYNIMPTSLKKFYPETLLKTLFVP